MSSLKSEDEGSFTFDVTHTCIHTLHNIFYHWTKKKNQNIIVKIDMTRSIEMQSKNPNEEKKNLQAQV